MDSEPSLLEPNIPELPVAEFGLPEPLVFIPHSLHQRYP